MTNGDTRHLDGVLEQVGTRWQLRCCATGAVSRNRARPLRNYTAPHKNMSGTFWVLTPLFSVVDSPAGTAHWCAVPSLIHGVLPP